MVDTFRKQARRMGTPGSTAAGRIKAERCDGPRTRGELLHTEISTTPARAGQESKRRRSLVPARSCSGIRNYSGLGRVGSKLRSAVIRHARHVIEAVQVDDAFFPT